MMWFCGGHGVCLTGAGPPGHIEAAVVAWLKRYVADDAAVDTGPEFEWLADDAQWRSAADYPVAGGHADHGDRQRHARAQPRRRRLGHGRDRRPRGQRRQRRRCRRRPPPPRSSASRSLTLTYSGTGARRHARLRADRRRGARRRRRQPGHADPAHARRPAAHDHAARWRRSPPPRRPARSTRCSSPAGRCSTGRCARPAAITFSAIELALPTAAPSAVSGGAGILAHHAHLPLAPALHRSASAVRTRRSRSRASA